jgi:hypothetical protein
MAAGSPCACALLALPHKGKHLLFVLLGLADLALTWALIHAGRGQVYESNPLAAWVLRCHGWLGLAAFKAATMGLVAGLVLAIACRRPQAASRLLVLACVAAGGVVAYSGYLGLTTAAPLSSLRSAQERTARTIQAQHRFDDFMALLDRLVRDVTRGASLVEAAGELELTALRSCSAHYLELLQKRNEGRPLRESLAANLLNRCVSRTEGPEEALRLARRLEGELCTAFGRQPPRYVRNLLAQVETRAAALQARRAAALEREVVLRPSGVEDQTLPQMTVAARTDEVAFGP